MHGKAGRGLRLLLLAATILAAAAGVSFATAKVVASGTGATIQACANQTNGALRVVSGAGDCRENEQFLTWPAQAGGALAFAHINAGGTLDASRSKNVVSVTPMTGTLVGYCIQLDSSVSGQVKNIVAQAGLLNPFPSAWSAALAGTGENSFAISQTGCPPSTDAFIVNGFRPFGNGGGAFYVLFN